MAIKNCFQVSGGVVQYAHPFAPPAADNNIHLPIYRGFNASISPSSSSSLKVSIRTRKTAFVCKAREALDEVKAVTDSSWDDLVIGSETPALVEFWAPWCGPCRMIAPVIDDLAKEYAGKISCFKVNTDECPNIANQYGIRSIPTVLFFNKGEKKESVIGAVPKSTLSSTIEKYVEA
ncbi:Thioredoxin [Euphorbia peplus]|nr:Thioredoxin [Euphorbia peplus]